MTPTWEWWETRLIISCIVNGQYVIVHSERVGFEDVVTAIRDHVGGEIKQPGIIWLSTLPLSIEEGPVVDDHNIVTISL